MIKKKAIEKIFRGNKCILCYIKSTEKELENVKYFYNETNFTTFTFCFVELLH